MSAPSAPVWFITGCSSGFGATLALQALRAGHSVIATSRNPSKTPDLVSEVKKLGGVWLSLDVTAPDASSVVQSALKIHGHIDYFINNAGYSLLGAVEDMSEEEYRHQMEVNFFAPLKLIQAILPSMRHRRSGLIANVSSIAGLDGIATCGLYCASKFALEGLSESLALELRPFNIRVLIVEPGAFRSNFLGAYITPKAGVSEAYKDTAVGRQMEVFAVWDGKQPGNVEEGCRRIFEVVTGTGMGAGLEGYLRLPLGSDWAERAEVKILHLQETRRVFEDVWRSTDYKEWGL